MVVGDVVVYCGSVGRGIVVVVIVVDVVFFDVVWMVVFDVGVGLVSCGEWLVWFVCGVVVVDYGCVGS